MEIILSVQEFVFLCFAYRFAQRMYDVTVRK